MATSAECRRHLVCKMDADASIVVRPKGQPVVDTRHANTTRRPPAVVPGDMGAGDIRHRCRDLEGAEGGDEGTVIRQGDAVAARAQQERQQDGKVALVHCVAEVFAHVSTLCIFFIVIVIVIVIASSSAGTATSPIDAARIYAR